MDKDPDTISVSGPPICITLRVLLQVRTDRLDVPDPVPACQRHVPSSRLSVSQPLQSVTSRLVESRQHPHHLNDKPLRTGPIRDCSDNPTRRGTHRIQTKTTGQHRTRPDASPLIRTRRHTLQGMTDFGPYPGQIDLVHDGDTIYVSLDLGFDHLISSHDFDKKPRLACRVNGINSPELSTQAGKDALAYANTLLKPGDRVKVVSHGWDKFGGRFDGTIILPDGTDFAQRMIDAGHAVAWSGEGPKPT